MVGSSKEIPLSFLGSALEELANEPAPASLDTFRRSLDPRWIEEALEATGTATLRKRRLPAEQVIWLVLGMALVRDKPIAEVVSHLDLALPGQGGTAVVAPSSVAQARRRLGAEPLEWLFNKSAGTWAHASARNDEWRGLALYAIDGTTIRVADSDTNRAHFGLATGGDRGPSGYPLVRLAALMAVRSHVLARAAFGPYSTSELALCRELWAHIPAHSVTILDRNFLNANVLVGLHDAGAERHWMTRAKSTTKWKVVKSYGRYDKLVELTVSSTARKQHPELPKTFTARAVNYRHPRSKGRQWLLTSLADPNKYPALELIKLYHERWEIELGYDEIKTHMLQREETIRSRTPAGVIQEIWGILIAFNLIRREMENIAKQAEVPPTRISFVTAMRFIRDEWIWCAVASPGSIPAKLQRMRDKVLHFVLPKRRSDRVYPRAVKIKMSNYNRKRPKAMLQTAGGRR
jgi:hypothetical protein